MVAFLRWAQSIVVGTLNGLLKFALAIVLLIVVLAGIGMVEGDGLPSQDGPGLDLRSPVADSNAPDPLDASTRPPSIMDIVLALDAAGRDARVKGAFLRLGTADLSVPQAEEIGAAIQRFRQTGKFVLAHSQGFLSNGLGDYLTAASASEIWMQPKSPFGTAGAGAGALFLRGLFDKFDAVPQMVKRSDFKSAADMYMEKDYTGPTVCRRRRCCNPGTTTRPRPRRPIASSIPKPSRPRSKQARNSPAMRRTPASSTRWAMTTKPATRAIARAGGAKHRFAARNTGMP
jgi:protease-4